MIAVVRAAQRIAHIGFCATLVLGRAAVASAVTFVVVTSNDGNDATPGDGVCATGTGACSLRAAVEESNSLPGADTVSLPAAFYKLELGELQVKDALTLSVSAAGVAVIDARFRSRVFAVLSPGSFTASHLRVQHGKHASAGGGIFVGANANLLLRDSVITRNRVWLLDGRYASDGDGGGLFNAGSASLTNVDVTRNALRVFYGGGGGVHNSQGATMQLSGCRISRNRADGPFDSSLLGGGIGNEGELSVEGVVLSRNRGGPATSVYGGGLYNGWTVRGRDLVLDHNLAITKILDGDAHGGGAYDEGEMTLDTPVATNNRAVAWQGYAEGGGISTAPGSTSITTLRNVRIVGNRVLGSSDIHGGGLTIDSPVVLTGGLIAKNVVSGTGYAYYYATMPYGGGIASDSNNVTFTDLAIVFNRAVGKGASDGGLYAPIPPTLNNVTFSGNVP